MIDKLFDFINNSPTAFHTVDNFKQELLNAGYTELKESNRWFINSGSKYFVTRNGSSIIAFTTPNNSIKAFNIATAHSDSPVFKLKTHPEMTVENQYIKLNTEKYGGMLFGPWFDRPLSIAGRAVVRENNRLCVKLVNIQRDLLIIPSLAIHMNREVNRNFSANPQVDLLPLYCDADKKTDINKLIADNIGVLPEQIVSSDLFVYNRMTGLTFGANNEFIASRSLDDLQCAWSIIYSLQMSAVRHNVITMGCIFDNEEVGSCTKQGADSSFLTSVIDRICESCNLDTQEKYMALSNSFMISADNAHAVHPNHQDKADPTNRPYLNRGIVIKYNANQKYTTDAVSCAIFKELCSRENVPYQEYANRSDIAGGSTLGNLSNRHISLNTVDIGLPQLAMHSPFETAGRYDTENLVRLLIGFYNSELLCVEN